MKMVLVVNLLIDLGILALAGWLFWLTRDYRTLWVLLLFLVSGYSFRGSK